MQVVDGVTKGEADTDGKRGGRLNIDSDAPLPTLRIEVHNRLVRVLKVKVAKVCSRSRVCW